jgi:hypothetical protein
VQIDTQIATAKRYPRTISAVKTKMLSFATLDEETAAACFFTLPRGGKAIQGPSVRLAEIAIASYGNLKAGARVISVSTSGDNPHVVVQAVCHDLENNTCISVEKRRRVTGKKSKGGKPDEDDVTLAANAASSIALRDAVFRVIPQALIRPVYEAAKRVAIGEVKSLAEKRSKVVDRLKQMGAPEARILAVIGAAKVDDITVEQLEVLVGLGTALKDGETTMEDAFPPIAAKEAGKPMFQAPAPAPAATTTATAPVAPEPAPAPEPTPTPEAAPEPTETPQQRLAKLVTDAGATWDKFAEWAKTTGFVSDEMTGFADVPDATCERLLKKPAALVKILTAA